MKKKEMKKKAFAAGVIAALVCMLLLCFAVVHRRVIIAKIRHQPMPKAPKWHFWVKKEDRIG